MQIPFFRRSRGEASADVSSTGSSSPASSGFRVENNEVVWTPVPSFKERYDVYDYIPRAFAAIEDVVKAVNARDFYFVNVDEKDKSDTKIKLMEKWETDFNASRFIEELARGWLKGGTMIFGPDYRFVQMTVVQELRADFNDNVQSIILNIDHREISLGATYDKASRQFRQTIPITDYTITHYIHDDRNMWGKPLYHSITLTPPNIKDAVPLYKGFLKLEQNSIKIHDKMASPRSLWIFPKLTNPNDINPTNPKSLAFRIKNIEQGGRLMGGRDFEGAQIITEPIDGQSRFNQTTELVKSDIEISTQSSASRLIEDPSAMADAREAGKKDDLTVLYVCELVRRLFDYVIIPRVIGDMSVEFRWGSSDDFEFNFDQSLAALREGAISKEEFREQWKSSGTRLDDTLFQKDNQPPQLQQFQRGNTPQTGDDEEIQELRKQAYHKIISTGADSDLQQLQKTLLEKLSKKADSI